MSWTGERIHARSVNTMSAQLDENSLVHSAQRGDLEAFNQIVDRYQSLLFRVALRILGDEDRASDATQIAWISAFRNFGGFRGGHLQSWLVRVLINTCYDEMRRRHWKSEVPLTTDDTQGDEVGSAYWLVDPNPGVEEIAESRELEGIMNECLQSVAPVYRTMLVLVDIEGLSYEEAAAAAGVPLGTVRSRLARARLALRQQLKNKADLLPNRPRWQIQAGDHTDLRLL